MKTDLKSIDAMIASIAKRGKVLRNDSHGCLVAILDHHKEHGDYTRLPKLIDAVKVSLGTSLSAAMITYVANFYTGLAWSDEDKAFMHIKGKKAELRDITAEDRVRIKGAEENQYFIGNARDLPFYEMEREVSQKPFDLHAAIVTLVKRAKAANEANILKGAHNAIDTNELEVLESLITKKENTKPTPQQVGANDTKATANKPVRGNKKREAVAIAA